MTSVQPRRVTRFVATRLLSSAVVLLGVLVVVFTLVHLVPGDPVRLALGTRYTPEAYEALRAGCVSRLVGFTSGQKLHASSLYPPNSSQIPLEFN